ncbi:MAG: hypothetical protein ACYTG0_44230, partial [Planctomycetota bacterium]
MTRQPTPALLRRRLVAAALAATWTLLPVGRPHRAFADDPSGTITLVADHTVMPDGSLAEDVAVVVRKGKIERISPAAESRGPGVRRLGPGSVLAPGMIDLFSSVGAVGETSETARFLDPDANAADALDPRHDDFTAALR